MIKLKQQIKALTASINDKWVPITQGMDLGRFTMLNCKCCRMYYYNYKNLKFCVGCPIAEDTNKTHCENTPLSCIADENEFISRVNHPEDMAELAYLCHLRRRLQHKLYALQHSK